MDKPHSPILITGATGTQGGAAARELLAHGHGVRILTRNPDGARAQALERAGAEVVRGDLDDEASVQAAMQGVSAVFSVQLVAMPGTDSERQQAFRLIETAHEAGVRQLVHTSVRAAGTHEDFPRWGTGYWFEKYWTDKWEIEEAVRHAGFASWTVLKPVFMMDNFAAPKAEFMFPHLRQGEIATALHADTKMQLIAGDDVGAFARAAFVDPERFHGQDIDLAAEELTMSEIAELLSCVLSKRVRSVVWSPEEALARGLFPGWVRSQEWSNEVGYRADIEGLARCGIPLTSFSDWVERHRKEIIVD